MTHLTTRKLQALNGDIDAGRSTLESAVEISGAAGDLASQSLGLQIAAFVDGWQGDWVSANTRVSRALEIARNQPAVGTLIRALWARGIVLTGKGEYDAALATYEDGLALAEKIGDANTLPRYLNSIAWLYGECGHYERALELIPRAVDGARRWRHAVGTEIDAYCQVIGADMFLDTGDLVLGREFLDRALRIVDDPATHPWMKWRYSMHLWVSLGEYWLAKGEPARAAEHAAQAAAIASRTKARKYRVRILRLQAAIARACGRWDEAAKALDEALAIAHAIGNPPQLWRTQTALARLYDARGDAAGAREAWRATRGMVDTVRRTVSRPELAAGFERSPLIREIYDAG
jgi:tetratricopeptide (TPR) repeat protein